MLREDTSWEEDLIFLFILLCEHFECSLKVEAQRFSNNQHQRCSDEELMTIYLFGISRGHRSLRAIYRYTCDHLQVWFPHMPGYVGFVRRLNRLGTAFSHLCTHLLTQLQERHQKQRSHCLAHQMPTHGAPLIPDIDALRLVDSFPIMLAKGARADRGAVAREVAAKGYCSAKRLYYYGMKLHVVAHRRAQRLPIPQYMIFGPAAEHDLTALHTFIEGLDGGYLFGDKIYTDAPLQTYLLRNQALQMHTPVRRKRGQPHLLLTQQALSLWVSQIRQPIESFFNWIEQKTGIQNASKVRSTNGLMVHAFGRLATALIFLLFNC